MHLSTFASQVKALHNTENMNLNLKRPLAFFDLETTGVNLASDRIVEMAVLKAMPDGSEQSRSWKINPGMPIPLESSLIHGIYDKDVAEAPLFRDAAAEIAAFLDDADLAGYNSNKFDIPMLMEEFLRAGADFDIEDRKFVDVQNIFHQMEQRTLKAAYKFYCDKQLINAHSAEADTFATYEILKAQIERYEGKEWEDRQGNISIPVENDVEALHRFTNLSRPVDFAGRIVYDDQDREVFSFGKHRGRPVEEVFAAEPGYYSWMMQGEFPLYTKKCIERIWHRMRKNTAAQSPAQRPNAGSAEKKPFSSDGRKPHPDREKKGGAITNDMLKNLQDKFKK